MHSKYSFDAFLMGNTAGPHEAYRFAKGGKLTNGFGFDMQLKEPLDFYAVTDHGVWLGIVPSLLTLTLNLANCQVLNLFITSTHLRIWI